MSQHKVTFAHAIGDVVKIKAIEANGYVETMSLTCDGLQYRVGYWFEGKRFVEWVRGDEIKPTD